MLKRLTLILLLFVHFYSFSQTACIDSFENKSLYNDRFKYITIGIPPPISGFDSSVIYNSGLHLIKKNTSNIVEWVKKMAFFSLARFTNSSNEITGVFVNEAAGPATGSRGIFKLANNGNLLWSKKIQISTPEFNNYGYLAKAKKGINDDIILCNAVLNKVSVTILNGDATLVKLSKNFTVSLPPGEDLITGEIELMNNSLYLVAITRKFQNIPIAGKSNLLLIKMDYNTGSIEKINYLHSDDLVTGTHPMYGNFVYEGIFSENVVLKTLDKKHLLMAGRKNYDLFNNNLFFALKIDSNLSIINSSIYHPPTSHTYLTASVETTPSIDNDGNILFAILRDSTILTQTSNSCYYFTTDSNLNITTQRKLNIKETGLNTNGYRLNAVPFLKGNNKAEVIFHTNSSQNDSVLHIVEIPLNVKDAPCRGEDFFYITAEKPTTTQLTAPPITEISPVTINITSYNILVQNDGVEERKFCVQKSICDTLKIKGNSKFCLPNDTATFIAYKNPFCSRKLNWALDTTAIKILSHSSDSTIRVKFLKPYAGYIWASFEGCVLKDSFLVEVSSPKQALSFGGDSMLCTGKTRILDAGAGFKTYRWQDNSSNQTFTVTTPGLYFAEVTDSCGNIFRDTIVIKPIDVTFNLSYPATICQYDTAVLNINPKLYDLRWSPSFDGLIQTNELKLFPASSTVYNLMASRFPGCQLTDTVLIKVQDCPVYIHIPTAFSPNNDGKNDSFKPLTEGRMTNYQFSIYNRFGQVVFNTTNVKQGWDGTVKGLAQNSGVFVYTCTYKFVDQPLVFKKGTVMLIR